MENWEEKGQYQKQILATIPTNTQSEIRFDNSSNSVIKEFEQTRTFTIREALQVLQGCTYQYLLHRKPNAKNNVQNLLTFTVDIGVFIVNFEHISPITLVFSQVALN